MITKKQYLKSKPVCKVTFKLSKEEAQAASTAKVLGDFNAWDANVTPMKKLKDGSFTQTLELAKDKEYQFKYLLDECTWENDWQADAYVPSPLAYVDNSVVAV